MPDLKIKVKIPFEKEYSGKYGDVLKKNFDVMVFEYDKTLKVGEEGLTQREVMEDFDRAAHGIWATMTSIVDSILRENDIQPKGTPDKNAVKTAQGDMTKELAPYKRNLVKLLEAIVDDLGGNASDEVYNPKDDKVGKKFLDTMEKLDVITSIVRDLEKAWEPRRLRASKLANAKPPVTVAPKDDDDWLDLVQEVQQDYAAFEKQLPTVRKRLKAKQPSLPPRKAAAKESSEQTKQREAYNDLSALYEKFAKRLAEIDSLISEVARIRTEVIKLLEAGRNRFADNRWPDLPDAAPVWNRLLELIKQTDKQVDKLAKLAG